MVIPGLGVFVVRNDGKILFSELALTDDGVLRSAVAQTRGVSDSEAARLVERFASDIRHTIEHGMVYRLEGLGVMSSDERGVIIFRSREEGERRRSSGNSLIGQLLAESAQPQPEPEAGPAKPAEPAQAPQPAETKAAEPAAKARPRRPARKKSEGADMFLIVAIVIAVVAVAAIAYGLWVASNREDSSIVELFVPSAGKTGNADGDAADADDDTIDLSIPSER